MQQRSELMDFYIRDQRGRPAETAPHRHEYFQIQVNLGGDTVQHIGSVQRPFRRNTLAFILPHRVHVIPHPADSDFVVINFSQTFLLPHLACDPMDLEEVSILQAPELSPFRFQEHLDFHLSDPDFAEVRQTLERMRALDANRRFGTREILKGLLLQLIGQVCGLYAEPLRELADSNAAQLSRRAALGRMSDYLRLRYRRPRSEPAESRRRHLPVADLPDPLAAQGNRQDLQRAGAGAAHARRTQLPAQRQPPGGRGGATMWLCGRSLLLSTFPPDPRPATWPVPPPAT